LLTLKLAQNKQVDPTATNKLKNLLFILQNEQQILDNFSPAQTGAKVNTQQLKIYSTLLKDFYSRILANPDLRQEATKLINEAVAQNVAYEPYMLKHLSSATDDIVTSLQTSLKASTLNIQLVAFLNTKKQYAAQVHIENFDNYSAGQYYVVPKWVTTFSQDDINSFNQAATLSSSINTAINNGFSNISNLVSDSLNSFVCFKNLVQEFQNKASSLQGQATTDLTTFITQTTQQLDNAFTAMQNLQQQKNNQGQNVLQQFNDASNNFLTLAKSLPANIATLESKLSSDAISQIGPLKTELDNCLKTLNADINLVSNAYNTISGIFQPIQGTVNSAQQITGNPFSQSIDQIPPIGYIDLKTTGERENGDELTLKVIVKTADDVLKNLPGQTIDNETIELQQISFYSESNVSVILASPISSNSQVLLKNKFQFAPSGSLVVKFGSRTSRFWNTINPGLGFNISTPDFNLDGAPDVSYGGVFTLFHNVLSLGLSYNTKTSSPFWFFGLSLPFSSLGLPIGGSVQTQKSN